MISSSGLIGKTKAKQKKNCRANKVHQRPVVVVGTVIDGNMLLLNSNNIKLHAIKVFALNNNKLQEDSASSVAVATAHKRNKIV